MYNATDYVNDFGDIPFSVLPFNDSDCISLCGVLYMPVENVVTSEFEKEPSMTMGEVITKLYAKNGYKHVPQGLFLNKALSVKFVAMRDSKRFADLKITGCISVYDEVNVEQFAASTLFLPDGTLFISYRGTDDTLIGWQEDMDVLVKGSIPSYRHSVDYIEKAAAAYDGKIIIAGHSKGGNVALYTALHCSEAVRKRLVAVYNNEGQGFADYSSFSSPEYKEILPIYKHIVPSASFIGMLLAHDKDYTVVKSSKIIGPMQHDLGTWQLRGGRIVTRNELDRLGRITEMVLEKLMIDYPKENYNSLYKIICDMVGAADQTSLLGLAQNLGPSVGKMVTAVKNADENDKKTWKDLLKYVKKIIHQSRSTVNKEMFERIKIQTAK